MAWPRPLITILTYRVGRIGKLWNRKSPSNLDGDPLAVCIAFATLTGDMYLQIQPTTRCLPIHHRLRVTTHSLPFIPRKSRPFCSTDDASSCTNRQRNQTCLNSLFTVNQSVLLSLQPVETRAARRVTNPAVLVGELDAIFSSTHAQRTERFYSTITRRKDKT